MADKIKAIKIKQKNGTYSEEVPISVNVQNVQWDENNHTLLDALGSVDISSSGKGNLQHQIDELSGDKIGTNQFNSRLNDFLKDQISADTTDWLDDNVNPVGSAVVVDKTLTIEGAAADAKAVGDRIATKIIPRDTDWNTIYNTGNYAVYVNYNYTNNPINAIGTLYVNNYPNRLSTSYTQYFVAQNFITRNGVIYVRNGFADNNISNIQWQDWNSVTNDNIQYGTDLKEIARETDWNNITETGIYQVYTNYDYQNAPNNNLGTLYVNNHYKPYSSGGGQFYITQIFFDNLGDTYIRYGLSEDNISNITWLDWSSNTKEIKILFIGNSLTQDAVSYLPYVIRNNNKNFPFKLYICYNGGFTLSQIYDSMTNNTPCQTFSKCENRIDWISESNTWTINDILTTFNFDIICLQPYFKNAGVGDEITSYNNCLNYIRAHYNKNGVKIVTLLHPPIRNNITVNMEKLEEFAKQTIKNTACEFAFRNDLVIYNAMQTILDNLGDDGHLSDDGIHCQEGLPCLIQSLYMYICLCEIIGCKYKSIYNTPIRITTAVYNSIHVPNPDIGTGVITGTDAQNLLAQDIAIKAYKKGKQLINTYSFPKIDNTLTQLGCPADAKKTGDEINILKANLSAEVETINTSINALKDRFNDILDSDERRY